MNQFLKIIIAFSLILIAFSSEAQVKRYKTVYVSEKTGDTWSGTKKASFVAAIGRNDKGEGPVWISLYSGNFETVEYDLTCDFEAMTGKGKAFHKVMSGGAMYGPPNWTSHTGSTEVNWVYLNKSIREILAEEEYKPFDIEIQFGDGSAVKYFISK